jgi:hypothetical protein
VNDAEQTAKAHSMLELTSYLRVTDSTVGRCRSFSPAICILRVVSAFDLGALPTFSMTLYNAIWILLFTWFSLEF